MRISAVVVLLLTACSTTRPRTSDHRETVIHGKLFASVFQQHAAEYKALCFQAFNTARWRLDQHLMMRSDKPRAIITDIDETVLDNSAYDVHQTLQGKDYEPASWREWISMAAADTVPGAPSFLNYAASRGITIFYITNRNEEEREGTLLNLQKFSLPNADNGHLVMRQGISSKEGRREDVMKNFEVIMLIGDNLADFSAVFDKKTTDERNETTRRMAHEFGSRFIIIPNPVYGDWESALYRYNNSLNLEQKDSIIRREAKSY